MATPDFSPARPIPGPPPGDLRLKLDPPTLQTRLAEYRAKAEDFCREDPVKALAIALAAGWLCGRLLHAVTSPRRKTLTVADLRRAGWRPPE